MNAGNFALQSYLDRIGYHGDASANIAAVTKMMQCQLFTVPFENLDVQAGKIVSLVPEERASVVSRNFGLILNA